MKVLNPSYDTVFKYLMEDIEIAQGIISRIINQEIVELTPLPQESTSIEIALKYIAIPLHRQDFVAAIKYTDSENVERIEKVMIEVQKSPFPPEVARFRQYIADKYHHRTKLNEKEIIDLPIRTIYIIEKTFNKALPPVLHVQNEYYDRLTGKIFEGKHDEFVDLLVHEAYFIQTNNLPPDLKDDLLRILSIFSPKYQIKLGKGKRYIDIDDKELNRYKDHLLSLIIRRLNIGNKNHKLLTALDIEISYENEWDKMTAERDLAIKQAEKERKQAEIERKQKEEAKEQAEKERKQAEIERKQKEEAKEQTEIERKQKEEAKEQAEKERKQAEIERKQKEEAKEQAEKERKQVEIERKQKEEAKEQTEIERKQKEEATLKLIETAKLLKSMGVDMETIAKKTGLTIDEIKNL